MEIKKPGQADHKSGGIQCVLGMSEDVRDRNPSWKTKTQTKETLYAAAASCILFGGGGYSEPGQSLCGRPFIYRFQMNAAMKQDSPGDGTANTQRSNKMQMNLRRSLRSLRKHLHALFCTGVKSEPLCSTRLFWSVVIPPSPCLVELTFNKARAKIPTTHTCRNVIKKRADQPETTTTLCCF